MLTSSELRKIPIFSCLNDTNLMWLSQQAADLHLEPGEYLIHAPPSFVVMGRRTEVSVHKPGDFFGELAILMATAAPASVRAKTACHLARLGASLMASQEMTSANARSGRQLSSEPKWFSPEKSKRSFATRLRIYDSARWWRQGCHKDGDLSSDVESCMGPLLSHAKPQRLTDEVAMAWTLRSRYQPGRGSGPASQCHLRRSRPQR